jgi:hypothetical protein
MRCRKCQGDLEPIIRGGKYLFHFCRPCKVPYGEDGSYLMDTGLLASSFNPLASVRGIISKTHAGATPVARTALEVLLMQGMWDTYMAGVKDGVLLAYSQDVGEGEPSEGSDQNGPLRGSPGRSGQD